MSVTKFQNFASRASVLVSWLVGGIWVLMGGSKVGTDAWLLDLDLFESLPAGQLAVSYFLPWFEIFLGAALIFSRSPKELRGAQLVSIFMLLLFLPVLVYMHLEGRTDCGCGGPAWLALPSIAILRNVVLVSLLCWVVSRVPRPGE
jgi:hypothetical protein